MILGLDWNAAGRPTLWIGNTLALHLLPRSSFRALGPLMSQHGKPPRPQYLFGLGPLAVLTYRPRTKREWLYRGVNRLQQVFRSAKTEQPLP